MLLAMFEADAHTMTVVNAVMFASAHNNKSLAADVKVSDGNVGRMKAGHDAGPGIARFGWCSRSWWIAFFEYMAPSLGVTVIRNEDLQELLTLQRRQLKMDLDGMRDERRSA